MPRTMRTLAGCPTLDRDPRILNRLSGTQYKCSGGTHFREWGVGVRWGRLRWVLKGVPLSASMRMQNRIDKT